jgi:uncharacterized membrane protein HdeD (DUF308 family)
VWQASTQSILWGVGLIVSGMLGGSLLLAAVSVNLVIAWLIVLSGMVYLVIAHPAHRAGSLTWRLMIGFAYVLFGVYLIASPVLSAASLALVLALRLSFEGIFDIALFFRLRAIEASSWVLLDGVVTLILGLMIYVQWPSTAAWAILVSVSGRQRPYACNVFSDRPQVSHSDTRANRARFIREGLLECAPVSRHPSRTRLHRSDAPTESRGRHPSTEFRYNRCIGGIVMNKVAR